LHHQPARRSFVNAPARELDDVIRRGSADRIGSIVTDDTGKIEFTLIPKDFNLPGKKTEEKPDLGLAARMHSCAYSWYRSAGSPADFARD
jgi:hypothetical protein